jgi:hypothetical protein
MTTKTILIGRGIGLGITNGVLLQMIMGAALLVGLAPMPTLPSLALSEALFGEAYIVASFFHIAYLSFWSAVWFVLDYPRLRAVSAAALAALLWILQLVVFFPIIGWGFFGLKVGLALTVGSLVLHILFAVLLCYYGRRLVRGDYDLS